MLIEEYYLDWEDDIEHHPGVKPLHSYLFVDDYFFCLKPQQARRLGQAEVSWYFEEDKEKWRKEKYGISLPLVNADERNKHDDFLKQRRNKVERLNNILVSLSASVMDSRIPVVSVGSYAIPSRLKQLYESENVSANSVIPVFQARLHGFNMVYANNITKKGAVRTVPVYSKTNTCIAHAQVMFMNIQQIALLQGNDRDYRLVKIDTENDDNFNEKRLEICDSGEILHHFYLYSCDDDPLTLPTTPSKWVMPPLKVIEVDKPQLPNTLEKTQNELLRALMHDWSMYASNLMNDEDKEIEGYRQASTPKSLRKNLVHEKVNQAFIEFLQQNCTQKSRTFEPLKIPETDLIPSNCLTYDQISTTWATPPAWGMRVTRTESYVAGDFSIEVPQKGIRDYIYRLRYPYILLKEYSKEGVTEYSPYSIIGRLTASNAIQPEALVRAKDEVSRLEVTVQQNDFKKVYNFILLASFIDPHFFSVLNWYESLREYFAYTKTELETSAQSKSSTHVASVNVNMTLRTAIGLEIGERLDCFTPTIPLGYRISEIMQDHVIPRRYLITRLQRGEPAAIEIGACLLPAETLQMLGIEAGDYVWLEGIPHKKNQLKIPALRLRAYPIPTDVIEQRATLVKNIEDALFPDCSERLGVFPDLDPIMLDEMARKKLNLDICSPVRIRASRRHQINKETRNFLLAFFLAAIGAVGIFPPLSDEQTRAGSENPALIAFLISIVFLAVLFFAGNLFIILGLRARLKP